MTDLTELKESMTFIEGGDEYELLASDDKATYMLIFKTEEQTAILQGDQLAAFHSEFDLVRRQYPAYTPDQRLAQIWDQGGYSWLAAEQEESGSE
jgi:hypothetical protein